MRSSDVLLALMGWNIAFYALLLAMVAHNCGFERGELVVTLGDAHIYENQKEGLAILDRDPLPAPILRILCSPDTPVWQYEFTDIAIDNYLSHPAIQLPMTV